MPMIGRKAAFPPLGLITFAAFMPEEWQFELIDLNVAKPSDEELRDRIADADAVFTGDMSVQKRSLIELLSGPAKGPILVILGGRIRPAIGTRSRSPNPSDAILHEGLDLLVWGRGQWIDAICSILTTVSAGTARAAAAPDP
jgi:hypothetical protein